MHKDKLISRRNGNSKQQEFRASRERKKVYQDEGVVIRAPLETVQWNKPPSGDVKHQDKTHQTGVGPVKISPSPQNREESENSPFPKTEGSRKLHKLSFPTLKQIFTKNKVQRQTLGYKTGTEASTHTYKKCLFVFPFFTILLGGFFRRVRGCLRSSLFFPSVMGYFANLSKSFFLEELRETVIGQNQNHFFLGEFRETATGRNRRFPLGNSYSFNTCPSFWEPSKKTRAQTSTIGGREG